MGGAADYGPCFEPADVMLVASPPDLSKTGNYISQKPSDLNSAMIEPATERNLWNI